MTHQELLDKLAYTPHTDPNGKYMYRALRAVVELHKPSGIFCRGCGFNEEYMEPAQLLPCPTIQAIEKELE
jgi:hypothetical protein